MRNDRFEWDDGTARANVKKHGVTFDLACRAFDDPQWVDVDDDHPNEMRYNRICMAEGRILVVTYVERGDRIRIISARKAEKHEQQRYVGQ
jgi:hypothetical protein